MTNCDIIELAVNANPENSIAEGLEAGSGQHTAAGSHRYVITCRTLINSLQNNISSLSPWHTEEMIDITEITPKFLHVKVLDAFRKSRDGGVVLSMVMGLFERQLFIYGTVSYK